MTTQLRLVYTDHDLVDRREGDTAMAVMHDPSVHDSVTDRPATDDTRGGETLRLDSTGTNTAHRAGRKVHSTRSTPPPSDAAANAPRVRDLLDERTRMRGLQGVAAARAALKDANRRVAIRDAERRATKDAELIELTSRVRSGSQQVLPGPGTPRTPGNDAAA